MRKLNIGILASHGGSNLQAIVDACKAEIVIANPVVVISNNSKSGALKRAQREGVPYFHISKSLYSDDNEVDYQITQKLLRYKVDLVVLAGYMKRLGGCIMSTFEDRIINTHPSLLPKFGGKGMYGIKVHESVLAAGEHKTGVTIHKVQREYDQGTVLAQVEVQVREDDTPCSLRDRVLTIEHDLYVKTLREISLGKIKLRP
jgi:phosphoribosylglycinamide formyltransferase-1